MTIEALRCFCAVFEEGSFRAAARRLHRSQPAVSQQVKTLEDELGQRLLDRRRATLTPAGQLLYDRARRILRDVSNVEREMAAFSGQPDAELRLGASDTVALYVLPEHVKTFTSKQPETRLVIVNRPTDALCELVERRELDLAVVTLPAPSGDFESRPLFRQRLVVVVPRSHALRRLRRVELADLADEPFLLLEPTTRTGRLIREHFRHAGFEPAVAMDSGSFEVIKRYVAQGVGVSVLPETVITERDDDLAALRSPSLPEVAIGAIWRPDAYHPRSARLFLELLASGAQDQA